LLELCLTEATLGYLLTTVHEPYSLHGFRLGLSPAQFGQIPGLRPLSVNSEQETTSAAC
jgi:hypothetical protein